MHLQSHACNYVSVVRLFKRRKPLESREGTMWRIRYDWQEEALCRQADADLFFPERGSPGDSAKRVCVNCSVRLECLEYALANAERYGIWGGLTERERTRLRRQTSQLFEIGRAHV